MKTIKLLNKIIPMALMLTLIVMVVMSCKKKDSTPDPTPTPNPVPTPLATPNVFQSKTLHIMSDYELSQNLTFPGHSIHQFGQGLIGEDDPEIPNPFKKVGKTLWEIYDYKHTEQRFDQIDNALTQISAQLTQLQQEVAALGTQLALDVTQLEQFWTAGNMNMYFTEISTVTDSSTHNGMNFYPSEGAAFQAGQRTPDQMNADTALCADFCKSVYFKSAAFNVCSWSEQLNTLLCPPSSGSTTNALSTYAKLIIQEATPRSLTDSASMMKLYMLLESYFLQVVNKQFQCVNVWSNACNFYDTTGQQANLYYTTTFTTDIKQEVNAFISAVDYLTINLMEYRVSNRFVNDMQYINAGLAPDLQYIHVFSRAQFIANLLYDALGLSYPILSGHIVTPNNYTTGSSPIVDTISFSITPTQGGNPVNIGSKAVVWQSQIPYTYWVMGSTANCGADNNWNVYRFNTSNLPSSLWAVPQYTIQLIDNNNGNTPWLHYAPSKGTGQISYYNPKNPSQTSYTKTSTCNFQFGYFSAIWPWGFLYMSNFQQSNWQHTDNFYYILYTQMGTRGNKSPAPQVGTTDGTPEWYPHGTASVTFSYPNNTFGMMTMTGSTISTSHYYIAYDCINYNMQAKSDPAGLNSADLQAWGTYNVGYTGGMVGSGGSDIWVTMGTNLFVDDQNWNNGAYSSNGALINNQHFHNDQNNWNSGFVYATGIKRNTNYSPSLQWVYQTFNVGSNSGWITLYTTYQMVYRGNFNLSDSK